MTRRVAITGLGTVNSLASNVKEFWKALSRPERHQPD